MAGISVDVNSGRFSQIPARLTNGNGLSGRGLVTGKWALGLTSELTDLEGAHAGPST